MIITKRIEEKDNQKLTKELQELKTRHKSFIEDYLKLKEKNKKLQEEIEKLKEDNQKLQKRIDILHYVIKR